MPHGGPSASSPAADHARQAAKVADRVGRRKLPNLSRTLRMMAGLGFVEPHGHVRDVQPSALVSEFIVVQDESFFDPLVRMFEQALKTIASLPEDLRPDLWARLDAVRQVSHNIGYGVGDNMDDLLAEYKVDV